MKKYVLSFVFIFTVFPCVPAVAVDMDSAIEKAKGMKSQIESECRKDPYSCSCEIIPCSDILQADDSRKDEAYSRCMTEKNSCEAQRQNGIKQMEAERQRIENACRKDLSKCDCSQIENENGKKQCELAVIDAKYEAEKKRADMIKICTEDISKCDCSSIRDNSGRSECETELSEAKQLRERMEVSCKENLGTCDCSTIESVSGKTECESKKKEAMDKAGSEIKMALSKCFKNIDACKCGELGIDSPEYVNFCEVQKSYGMSCKKEGLYCDKLDAIEIYPPGMPVWLGKIFSSSYKSYIDAEKSKGAKEAASIITSCVRDPENCKCDSVPTYAKAFCEKNRSLQIKCRADDYDACMVLDRSPNLPEGMPKFTLGPIDSLVNGLRQAEAGFVQGNASRKVGNMIMACMDNADKCDCSIAPAGNIKSFCERKKNLVRLCLDKKNYDSCFMLSEETIVPPGTPSMIANYLQNNIAPQMLSKQQNIFDRMKKGTSCESVATISDCKMLLKK
ncbi:MAG: hypothetical protein UT05_C0003G0010 [Parcubacteria group bacterium GW2011_GWF2_38_76]|nr:MAG: hypothetical protein UT05_C0003G0010 [Parcubacteria group bacterium GW2011_GWF2_38_76]HBM46216.1 hypothetical protein [Patescibacteria group bacterium]